MGNNIRVGLVIMASGLGVRFGGNKLMESLGDKPLIKWIIDSSDGIFDKRVVVTRSSEVKKFCDSLNIDCIIHEFPNRNDTVRLGLSALMNEVDYCFFTPGDQPLISSESISRLVERAKSADSDKLEDSDRLADSDKLDSKRIVRASYGEEVGSPVGFSCAFFKELLSLPEKKGGGWIAKNNPDMVDLVEVSHEYELWDVDTVSDLEKIKNVLKMIGH